MAQDSNSAQQSQPRQKRRPAPVGRIGVVVAAMLGLVLGMALLVNLVAISTAKAYDEKPRRWGFSTEQMRKVGNISGELSKLCRLGQFNQRRIAEYYIAFGGESRDLIGIAKKNYNLYDPLGKADPAQTYHFHYDGTSQCKVFVAP